jgi:hypothetical protein
MRIEDVRVDDPKEASSEFKAALAQAATAPKIATRRKQAKAQPKKTSKD